MLERITVFVGLVLCLASTLVGGEPALEQPVRKITPGQVIVPTERMRRIWGELISLDPATRTGTFRNESNDTVMPFTILPYAELLHHAAFGDVQDFRAGERAIFRLHENEAGEWVWLTYIQDEMNFLNGHKEYYHIDSVDADKKEFTCTDANADKSYVREKGLRFETNGETRYWKAGQPATFAGLKVGEKVRTKTRGTGKGKVRLCWEVFLDDESFLKFQTEQKAVHAQRMTTDGSPGYVDSITERTVTLTLFQESGELARKLKKGMAVRVAPAGTDRKAAGDAISGTVTEGKMAGNLGKVSVTLNADPAGLKVGNVARVWGP